MYYKVVSGYKDKLISSSIPLEYGGIEYKLNEWVYPQILNSKLYIFNCLANARTFVYSQGISFGTRIYIADAIGVSSKVHMACNWGCVEKFWKLIKNKKKYSHLLPIYQYVGTLSCDAVKLIKKVE